MHYISELGTNLLNFTYAHLKNMENLQLSIYKLFLAIFSLNENWYLVTLPTQTTWRQQLQRSSEILGWDPTVKILSTLQDCLRFDAFSNVRIATAIKLVPTSLRQKFVQNKISICVRGVCSRTLWLAVRAASFYTVKM